MSMEGRYSARSQEGGAVMSMEGRYSARSQEGGAVMSMDGRYVAKSQGRQCEFSNKLYKLRGNYG